MKLRFDVSLVVLFAGAALLWFAPDFFARYGTYVLSFWMVMSVAAMGLNLTLGYAGQISLAQAAFMGIGAYTTALMTTNGYPFLAAFAVAGLLSFFVGLLLGFPALRVQHHYLAFVTLAFSSLAWLIYRNEEWLTGGTFGIANIPRPSLLGMKFTRYGDFHHFTVIVTLVLALGLWWLIRSPWGRAFTALRENPVRASSLGVNVKRYTLLAFAIGSAYGGFSGALYACLVQFIDPAPFALGPSLMILLMVIVGGAGYFLGPFVGAFLAVLLPEWLQGQSLLGVKLGPFYLILFAIFVMALLVLSPTGLFGFVDKWVATRKTIAASKARATSKAMLDQGS
jgi:branched-chain amino acid transport system permease protein